MECKLIGSTNIIFAPKAHYFDMKSCSSYHLNIFPIIRCTTTKSKIMSSSTKIDRRSAGFKPGMWNIELLGSSKKDHKVHQEDDYANMLEKVKREVNNMMNDEGLEPLTVIKLIDDIQRLGLGDYFSEDTDRALKRLVCNFADLKLDLHATALGFRLLRQSGIFISQDIFKQFVDENGKFMSSLCNDKEGMINLYEASYLGFEGEHLLDEAKVFTKEHLINHLKNQELPLRYRISKLEAKHYAETHPKKETALLELAMLDFNRTQLVHQQDLHEMARWWKELRLSDELNFARDRIMECFYWTIGIEPKLEHSACRKIMTKVIQLITVIDDIYDVYGTLDELELFTNAIERWDINNIDELPDYMKVTFLALFNTINEIGYEILKLRGQNSIPYLKKAWIDLCKAFLVEAKWCYNNQTPTFEEYVNNGLHSISAAVTLTHAFFYVSPEITPEALHCLNNKPDVFRFACAAFRLVNDLATSEEESERGETAQGISCYAEQEGVSMKDARKHLSKLIDDNWKRLNEIQLANQTPLSNEFIETTLNILRTAQCIYQHGDGFGSPQLFLQKKMASLIVDPLQL